MGSEMRPVSTSPTPTTRVATPPARTLNKRARPRLAAPASAPAPRSTNDGSVAQLCVDEINRYRATLGLRPLQRDPAREGCADGQIRDDAESGRWHGSSGRCGESLQNECMESPNDEARMIKNCLRGMWAEGPGGGHYEAMKNESMTRVWLGF
jgi:hypothetical protein